MKLSIQNIYHAQNILKNNVVRTPITFSKKLSEITGAKVWTKNEIFQATNSFKDRGAYIKINSLSEKQKQNGVIAMSAGNHAQAVAWHAKKFNINAHIVMPKFTPFTKVEQTKALGAHVILEGNTLDDAKKTVEILIKEKKYTLIHPYDDDLIISGQGSIALEIIEDVPNPDALIIPIGGGGLIAGNAIAAKEIKKNIKIYGVESELYPSMKYAINGQPKPIGGTTLADGIAVKSACKRTTDICKKYIDDIFLVSEKEIENAIYTLLEMHKIVAEGAGAIGLAALIKNKEKFQGKNVVLVICGGNIDQRILTSIIYRELERQQRIVHLRIIIDDQPGMLAKISHIIGKEGINILDVSHHRTFLDVPAKGAELNFRLETPNTHAIQNAITELKKNNFNVSIINSETKKYS